MYLAERIEALQIWKTDFSRSSATGSGFLTVAYDSISNTESLNRIDEQALLGATLGTTLGFVAWLA